jgi:hypothetical protein
MAFPSAAPTPAEFIESYGPTPLDEITARLPGSPQEVAEQINQSSTAGVLQITDAAGNRIQEITPDQAESESFVVEMTPSSLRKSFR